MKKILIIENRPDYNLGGVENYNLKLIEIIKKNYKDVSIDRCCLLNCRNNKIKENNIDYKMTKYTKWVTKKEKSILFNFIIGFHIMEFRKFIYKLNKKNNYDLIIDSTITYFETFSKQDNYIWVQHVTPSFYNFNHLDSSLSRNIFNLSWKLFKIKNPILNNKNIVMFDEYNYNDSLLFKKQNINEKNIYFIQLSEKINKLNLNNINNRKGIIYLGRIDDAQKNVSKLIELNKKLNYVIHFYGDGKKDLIEKMENNYKGFLKQNEILNKLQEYKFLILISKYEGFPFSAVQALSIGLPIILADNFSSSKFLIDNNKNGTLLEIEDTKNNIKKINDLLNLNDKDYYTMTNNSYEFAKKYLNDTLFENKWIQILNKYLKN